MFQHKIDEIFSDIPNVFGIADDILVIGYAMMMSTDLQCDCEKGATKMQRSQPQTKQRKMPF